jgi:hypothetical protein
MTEEMTEALGKLADKLAGLSDRWLIGGSCGLLLQNVSLPANPRDIDLYADAPAIENIHKRLEPWCVHPPALSTTEMYRSTLGRYRIEKQNVELVGGFQVETANSTYAVEIDKLLSRHAVTAELNHHPVRIMPLAHELVFNVLRNRPDRYLPIAAAIADAREEHQAALLSEICRRNRLAPELQSRIFALISRRPNEEGDPA